MSICITSHIHIAPRSQNMSYDQKQFISDYICPHALDACYYYCLCLVMTFLFLAHFTQKNVCLECMKSNFISHKSNQGVWLIWWHEFYHGKWLNTDLITLIILGKDYKFWNISLFNFLKPLFFFFLPLRPKYLLQHPLLKYRLPVFFA